MEWKEKLYGTYPVVQMASIAVPSPVGSAYAMKLLGVKNPASFLKEQAEINWQKLPYLKDVLPEEMFVDRERNRMVILVSDNLRITEKVAAVATYRLVAQAQQDEMQEFGFDYDDYDEYEYDADDEERQPGKSENQRMNMAYACTYVNFQKEQAEEDRSMNLLGRLSSMMSNSIFFTGIAGNGKLDEQIDVIQASESVHKFVHVRKNQCKEAWVLGLRQRYDAIVVEIPDVPEAYYCSVIQEMLPALACTLADDLTPEKLVQRVKQRAVLDEETLVWILSQAVSHAQKKAGGITDLPARLRGACTVGRGCTYKTAQNDGTSRYQADPHRIQRSRGRNLAEQGFARHAPASDLLRQSGNRQDNAREDCSRYSRRGWGWKCGICRMYAGRSDWQICRAHGAEGCEEIRRGARRSALRR